MKNDYTYEFKNSDFWKWFTDFAKTLVEDMDHFRYSPIEYINKLKDSDQRLGSFILMMKFIAFEEEIVDSKIKPDYIIESLGSDVIDSFVYNRTNIFHALSSVNTLKIIGPDYVLKDKEHDSRWILGVIKKCIAHGNFSFDFDRGCLLIDNKEKGNELTCEVGCYWLAQLGNMISPERVEILTQSQLFLKPYILNPLDKRIKRRKDLIQYLKNDFYCYSPLIQTFDGTLEEQLNAKRELNDFWMDIIDKRNIIEAMPEQRKEVEHGRISLVILGEKHHTRIINELEKVRNFYSLSKEAQYSILTLVMYDIACVEVDPSMSHNIDYGLDLLLNQALHDRLEGNIARASKMEGKIPPSLFETFGYTDYYYGSFKKKLALAYMLGIILFAGNKDKIYDEYVDYDSFDLSNVIAYDYAKGAEVAKNIADLEDNIKFLESKIATPKILKAIEQKKERLVHFQSMLIDMEDGTLPKVRPSNSEIFHRIRNAFSHKQFRLLFKQNEDGIVEDLETDYIMLYDEDKFQALVHIDKLLDLLMSNQFLQALMQSEEKTQTLK